MRSLRVGHAEEKINAITAYATHPVFSEAERAALAYAEGLTKTPVDVPDGLFDALRAHYDTQTIVEITVFAAFQNFNAKFNGALRTEINDLCPIATPGGKWEQDQ